MNVVVDAKQKSRIKLKTIVLYVITVSYTHLTLPTKA